MTPPRTDRVDRPHLDFDARHALEDRLRARLTGGQYSQLVKDIKGTIRMIETLGEHAPELLDGVKLPRRRRRVTSEEVVDDAIAAMKLLASHIRFHLVAREAAKPQRKLHVIQGGRR